ncbi:hypothetical protein AB0465_25470 [Streptomyces griseoviridis]|uniref:Uncharacterized protein n=2 Tax=Streptomyces TaxID=1883 RepID=A0A3S9Z577_STRGD|nr:MULTISPECIES: hypothetical protein [Streptomyces]AZS82905.1 hypothetical protein ELQ87_00265 [Streptomyces griseoviridis]MDT0470766.1 hypothetical protein [Streptomyces sp. DSM 41014]QCN90245.1 hypothetical protein DDJ31_39095 [Streptomyces griseoviridis]
MYLVHLTIAIRGGTSLPADIKQVLETNAPDVLEHVSVHSRARPHLAISLFLRAASLDEAEKTAEQIWERAVTACPRLAEWTLLSAEVPLLPYDLE